MRTANRLLSFLVGIAVAGAGALAVAEIVASLLGRSLLLVPWDQWDAPLRELAWDDPVVSFVSAGLITAGVLLLIVQLTPRRPLALPLRTDPDNAQASIDRRGLGERLRRAAVADPDVLSAKVRIRRKAKVTAQVPPDTNKRETRARVRESVRGAIAELGLHKRLRSKVKLATAKERVR
jgi:hypothetical protein